MRNSDRQAESETLDDDAYSARNVLTQAGDESID